MVRQRSRTTPWFVYHHGFNCIDVILLTTCVGLSSGHVPNSISLPFSSLIDPISKKLKPAKDLKEILLSSGINPASSVEKRLMCGTGVTAVVLDIALEEAGIGGKKKLYDGSWTLVSPFFTK